MLETRLTKPIERESALSNWYDLSRGFIAALEVTLHPGAVSPSVLSATTHPDVPISRPGLCSQSQRLYMYHRHLHSALSAAFPDRTLHTHSSPH